MGMSEKGVYPCVPDANLIPKHDSTVDFRGTLFPDEPKLDFQEWSGTVAASQRLVQLDRS